MTPSPAEPAPPAGTTRFRRMSLRSRLSLVFALGSVVVALVVTVATVSLVHLADTRQVLLTQIDPASLAADQLFEAYLDEETGVRGYILSRNAGFAQPYLSGNHEQAIASTRLVADLRSHPQLLALAESAHRSGQEWTVDWAIPTIVSTREGNPLQAQEELLGPGKVRFDALRNRFASLDAALASARSTTGSALADAADQLTAVLLFGLVLLVLAGIAIERALRAWVVGPLAELGGSARRVAKGELNHSVAAAGPPEIARVGEDVEAMRLRIVNELDEVASARGDLAEQNRVLQRSNEELEQFAYVASHDLQEPLRKVTSFVQLLQTRYEHQLDERADEYIGFAVDGARRMQALIDDLLTFSRVGRTTDSFVTVRLDDCVQTALDGLAGLVADTAATVHVGPLPALPGDPVLLTSLWQNLLGNAIKFRGDDPPVVTVASRRDGPRWLFSVSDNGIGIEPRHAERVFVIFQRLHPRDMHGGTGIGLALCRKIVEFHGGTIWVDEGFVGGARLCFTLPGGAGEGVR